MREYIALLCNDWSVVSGRSSWRSGNDLGQLYDNVTPNPTGSLSGPYFVEGPGKTVIGIKGKTSNIACSIKNLGNLTVRKRNNVSFHSVCGRFPPKIVDLICLICVCRSPGSDTATPTYSPRGCSATPQTRGSPPSTSPAVRTGCWSSGTPAGKIKVRHSFCYFVI